MQLFVVVEAVEDLLLGLVADGTGVVENQPGLCFGVHLAVALTLKRANDFFRVMGVHLAAEGLKIEGFFGATSQNPVYRLTKMVRSVCR